MRLYNMVAAMLLLSGVAAQAEEYCNFYPTQTELNVQSGSSFELTFTLDNTISPTSFQYYILAPEGITVAKKKLKYDVTYTSRLDPEVYETLASKVEGKNEVLFAGYCSLDYMVEEGRECWIGPGSGLFSTVKMSVAEDLAAGEYTISVIDPRFISFEGVKYLSPDAEIKVTVSGTSTGIESIVRDDAQPAGSAIPAYYTLTGVRIDKPTAPGIYIKVDGPTRSKIAIR